MVCCSPLSLASFPLSTLQQAALGCEASCTWIAGMLAAAPAEDLVTKEHTVPVLQHLPLPHVCEYTTLQLLCTAITNHFHHCGPLPTRLLASRTQPVPAITTMGRTAALLYSPLPPLSSVALHAPKAPFLPPARQRSVMPRDTTAHVRGGQAVPAHKHACVCVSQPLSSPTSTWIRAATTAAETSRPRCSLGGGTPSMQLLSHLCVAAIQWPIGMHRRHQATRHWTLARFRGHTLPSMKCVWHIGCTDPRHTALCSAPLSAPLHSCRGPCATTTTTTTNTSSR